MAEFEIVEARPWHCGAMARRLRAEHQRAIGTVGKNTHRELRFCFDDSGYRRAFLIDGQLAGLGGVMGPLLAPGGYLWLALSQEALRFPLAIIKHARRELDEIMTYKRELATTIIAGDEAARRFAVFLGFHVADSGPGSRAVTRLERRDLSHFLESNEALRIPVGGSYAIALGYHSERAFTPVLAENGVTAACA